MANPSLEDSVTTQASALIYSAADQSQLFPFFPRLPSEIRQLIWLMTFSPRVIQIKVHSSTAPKDGTKLASISFTATEDLIEIPSSYAKFETIFSSINNSDGIQGRMILVPSPALSKPSPPGPAALYVCSESRRIALEHYELAFGGVNLQPSDDTEFAEAWQAGGSWEKKIWVDFKRDLIVIENHANVSPTYLTSKPTHPLYRMTKYAKEETRKIQRLAVSECWYPDSHPGRLVRPTPGYPMHGISYFDNATGFHRESAASYLRKTLKDFKNIKELEVYEIGGRPVPIFIDTLRNVENNFLIEDMTSWRQKLLDEFEREKQNTPEWTADLPVITVRKGLHGLDGCWDGTFLT